MDSPIIQNDKGVPSSIQKKSLSMKPMPTNKEQSRPIEHPTYLVGASNIHSTDEALHH